MDQPDWTPLSFHPNAPPRSPSIASVLHQQQAVPAQRVQQQSIITSHVSQSHANTHPTPIPYGTPSAEQHAAAIANLHGVPIPTVFAWLKGLRSFLHGEQGFDPSQLSYQHYQAVSVLIGCSNEFVQTWLNVPRSPGILSSFQNVHRNINTSNRRVAANSFAQSPSSSSSRPLIHPTPRNPGDQNSYSSSRDASVGIQSSSAYTSNNYVRSCFICKDPGPIIPIKTFDGFKRHMREHYMTYCCIPRESVSHTEDGPTCTFCGLSNPDPRHPNVHSDPKCGGKKYTRKENLIKHLEKKHGVRRGSVLADQFEYTVNQKYFACGFCVFCCGSLNELVNHIDAHYRCSKHIRDWDDNKVIRGLLSQPNVNEYWRHVLAANPRLQDSWFTWKPTYVKQLKFRLEMSQEPADILCQAAKAAIDVGSYGMSQQGHDESIPFPGFREMGMDTSHSFQTLYHKDESPPLSHNLEPGPFSYSPRKAGPILQSQDFARDTDGLNGSDWDTDNEDRPSPQIASSMYGSPVSTMYHHADHRAQPWSPPSSSEGFMQHQHPTSVSITLASNTSQTVEGSGRNLYSSSLGGYWTGTPPTDPRSRQGAETHRYSAQPHADSYYPISSTQQASSPLSCTRETSPFTHLNSGYNPSRHPILATQSSHQEMRDRHGIDMSLDSDSQQRFMQDQGRSRNQRRYI